MGMWPLDFLLLQIGINGQSTLVRRALGTLVWARSDHHSSLHPGWASAQCWPLMLSAMTGMATFDGDSPSPGPGSQARLAPAGRKEPMVTFRIGEQGLASGSAGTAHQPPVSCILLGLEWRRYPSLFSVRCWGHRGSPEGKAGERAAPLQ